MDRVTEANHVVDLSPTVFADPSIAAAVVSVERRRQNVSVVIVRRSLVADVEGEGAHHSRSSEWMGQHEGHCHLQVV